MRIAAQILLAYALVLVLGSLWRLLPFGRATPDVIALCAVYLGLTTRAKVAPATLGAAILGYLGDLLTGTPRGMLAFVAALTCLVGHLIHRRLLVRGLPLTVIFSFVTGLIASIIVLVFRLYAGLVPEGVEIGAILLSALYTGLVGPWVFRLCRRVDRWFVHAYHERGTVFEG